MLATGDDVDAPVRWLWVRAPPIAAVGAEGDALDVIGVEDTARDDEEDVAGAFAGTFDVTVEMVWHTVEVAWPASADSDGDVLSQPAAFALPAVRHQRATAPSAMAMAQMATDSDPLREERM